MLAFQVCGYRNSGKTTTVRELIQRIKIGGNRVASVKQIHFEGFQMDPPNKNTAIHRSAGANPVVARAEGETDFLYSEKMDLLEIVPKISADWLIVEGFNDFPLPKIVCGKTEEEVDALLDRRTFAVSGVISNELEAYRGLPVLNPRKAEHAQKLWEIVSEKVFPMLPYVDEKCCGLCGLTCPEMVEAIIQGEKKYTDCTIDTTEVKLKIGGKQVSIVPFVQNVLRNNVLAIVKELDGWEQGRSIEVTLEK